MARPRKKNPVSVEFGERIRTARKARGWTQAGLGEEVELNRTYIGRIERGENNPTLMNINKLALVLGRTAVGFLPCCPPPRRRSAPRKMR